MLVILPIYTFPLFLWWGVLRAPHQRLDHSSDSTRRAASNIICAGPTLGAEPFVVVESGATLMGGSGLLPSPNAGPGTPVVTTNISNANAIRHFALNELFMVPPLPGFQAKEDHCKASTGRIAVETVKLRLGAQSVNYKHTAQG